VTRFFETKPVKDRFRSERLKSATNNNKNLDVL